MPSEPRVPTNPRSAHEYGEEHAERQDYGEEIAAVCYVESPGAVCPWRLARPHLCVCEECAGEGCRLLFIKAHCPHLVTRVSRAGIALRLRGRAQPVGIGVGTRAAAEESMYGGGGGSVGGGGGHEAHTLWKSHLFRIFPYFPSRIFHSPSIFFFTLGGLSKILDQESAIAWPCRSGLQIAWQIVRRSVKRSRQMRAVCRRSARVIAPRLIRA